MTMKAILINKIKIKGVNLKNACIIKANKNS